MNSISTELIRLFFVSDYLLDPLKKSDGGEGLLETFYKIRIVSIRMLSLERYFPALSTNSAMV